MNIKHFKMSLLGVNTMRLVGRRSFSVASVLSSDNAGAIRDAGGKFGEIETAAENVYFRKVVRLNLIHSFFKITLKVF